MDDVPAKRTHIMLGKAFKSNYITTHQRQYSHKGHGHQPIDKNFVYNIKTNHFDYGDTRPQTFQQIKSHYTSQANLNYNNKGDASSIRSVLDEAKKNDLRQNHFTIGGNSASVRGTTMNQQFRPASAAQRVECRPGLNQGQKNNLRASHWSFGPPAPIQNAVKRARPASSSSAYVTSSMLQYKWVQPFPRKVVP